MKNLLFFFVFPAFILLLSCTKSAENHLTPSLPEYSGKPDVKNRTKDLRVYYDEGGENYGCRGTGGNCLPTVIVTPARKGAMDDIFSKLRMASWSGKKNIFSANSQLLQEFLPAGLIDGVISGELDVRIRDSKLNPQLFILFYEKGNLTAAIPFEK